MQNVNQLVIETLAETLKLKDLSKIKAEDNLRDDLGLDSMSSLTFLINLEEKIKGFYVDPDTLGTDYLLTVNTIISYVNKQINLSQERVA